MNKLEIIQILNDLSVNYNDRSNIITMPCFLHGGDNPNALSIKFSNKGGVWQCFTRQCHQRYGSNLLGFIQACLDTRTEDYISKEDTKFWYSKKFNKPIKLETNGHHLNKEEILNLDVPELTKLESVNTFKKENLIPANYYLKRGYKEETLQKHYVGQCVNQYSLFYNHAVIPIFDTTGKFIVGKTARSIFEECKICGYYHPDQQFCPDSPLEQIQSSKWLFNKDFPAQYCLYNFANANESILNERKVILCESPGNCWKIEEAGFDNVVAVLGVKFTKFQKLLLEKSGATTIIVIGDNDEAGLGFNKRISQECSTLFTTKVITLPENKNDVADCTIEEIQDLLN